MFFFFTINSEENKNVNNMVVNQTILWHDLTKAAGISATPIDINYTSSKSRTKIKTFVTED